MLINWQPVLGRGCSHEEIQLNDLPLANQPMRVNLIGHPEETRFLAFAALKETYQNDDDVLPDALRFIAMDLQSALETGIEVRSGETLRLAAISCKGDWPWLIESGNLLRHFRRAPKLAQYICMGAVFCALHCKKVSLPRKKGESQCAAVGICHYCLAGQAGYPFTDCGDAPRFLATVHSAAAAICWNTPSALTVFLPQMPDNLPQFFRVDIWHSWHLGLGRYFLSSALVLLVSLYPGNNIPDKFEEMSTKWRSYCRSRKRQPILQRITREIVNYGPLDWPDGGWQKAETTTLLCAARLKLEKGNCKSRDLLKKGYDPGQSS